MVALSIPYRDPLIALAPLCDQSMSMLLHGSGEQPTARWSYLLADPIEVIEAGGDGGAMLAGMQRRLARVAVADGEAPFRGGWAGFFGYEFGAMLDGAMPQAQAATLPRAAFGLYDCVAAFDHEKREAMIFSSDARKARRLSEQLGAAPYEPPRASGGVDATEPASRYQAHVRRLVERIRAGDLFQANISRLFAGALGADDHPYAVFVRLCRESPAPFCAYMRLSDTAIVSNSPERLAQVTPTRAVRTSPIKGTRPRGGSAREDAELAAELTQSEKDRAENLMIVDLMRNDISRACKPGSVRTPDLFKIESYSNVHHLVSTIEGELKPGLTAFDLMAAIFPAGSITGAPKIKAMQVIDEVERAPREAFYGSIAWFGADGAMDSNVLIRTAICRQRSERWDVSFRVGGGITSDSDPEAEAMETETKALRLLHAIQGDCA
ncbi:MAG TPA: anthranilate synthase component I family protein [Caulobacterales bacterium]|nr:anthranilate synthase component I family protein [Caulobacterales bacterium]